MPGTVPSRGKLCTKFLRYLVYSCARRRSIETYRSRNNNRRAYIFDNVFFDLANSTRLIPVTIKPDRKALYTVYFLQKKKKID